MTTIKPWGYEELLEVNDNYVVKKLFMKDGHRCSLQKHVSKKETIIILSGKLTIYIDGLIKTYCQNKHVTILPNSIHRMSALDGDVLYLECSTNHLDDIIRIEDDYNR